MPGLKLKLAQPHPPHARAKRSTKSKAFGKGSRLKTWLITVLKFAGARCLMRAVEVVDKESKDQLLDNLKLIKKENGFFLVAIHFLFWHS